METSKYIVVGEITHEEAVRQAPRRIEESIYFGIPAYIGDDEELNKIYDEIYDEK